MRQHESDLLGQDPEPADARVDRRALEEELRALQEMEKTVGYVLLQRFLDGELQTAFDVLASAHEPVPHARASGVVLAFRAVAAFVDRRQAELVGELNAPAEHT